MIRLDLALCLTRHRIHESSCPEPTNANESTTYVSKYHESVVKQRFISDRLSDFTNRIYLDVESCNSRSTNEVPYRFKTVLGS